MSTSSRTPRTRAKAGPQRRSIVRRVADAIRRDALERADGELLGSEDDLIRRYDVSRPSLRQAAALVSQENLLVVKRGVGGGYFARRPDSQAVTQVAVVYLRSRRTQVEDIIRSYAPIHIELARLGARNPDPALKARLRAFLDDERQQSDTSYGEFLRQGREFSRLLEELAGNNVLALFLEILLDCSALLSPDEDMFRNRPERVAEYRTKRNRLAEALIEGDEEMAVLAASRCASDTIEWTMQELERQEPPERLLSIPNFGDEPAAKVRQA
jgi:GntR family transcriptional repressor for pyruvate dehydrogenase complex